MPRAASIAICLLLCSTPVAPAAAAKRVVACNEGQVELNVSAVQRRSRTLGKKARRAGVHLLDLGEAGRERYQALQTALSAKNWCEVNLHVQGLEALIDGVTLDERFLRQKAERVEGWVRGTLNGGRQKRASRLVDQALRDIERGRLKPANGKLNKVLTMLSGQRDLMEPPKRELQTAAAPKEEPARAEKMDVSDIVPSSRPSSGVLSESLALESCPSLEQGEPSNGELASIFERLRSAMSEKKYRAVDFKYGPELFEIILEEGRDGSRGQAATAACVLLTRIAEARMGLGVVQGRFSRVNELRDERGVPPSQEARFTDLVREATDQIAAKKFPEAFVTLDELLILLGDPVDQADEIP